LNIPKLLRWRSFTPLIIVLIACSAACSFTFFLTSASLEVVEVPLRDLRGELIVLFEGTSNRYYQPELGREPQERQRRKGS